MCIRDSSYVVVAAQGYKKVKSADIASISDDKKQLGKIENIQCDCICVSGFWTPTIHLASQSGGKTKFKEEIDAFVPDKSKQKEVTLGSANGVFTLEETLKTSFDKGLNYLKQLRIITIANKYLKFQKKNTLNTISFGVFRYQKEKNIKDF